MTLARTLAAPREATTGRGDPDVSVEEDEDEWVDGRVGPGHEGQQLV